MSLLNYVADHLSVSDAAIVAAVNDPEADAARATQLFHVNNLSAKLVSLGLSLATAATLVETIEAIPGGKTFVQRLAAGEDLTSANVRASLAAKKAGQSTEVQSLIDLILRCGIDRQPKWKTWGLSQAVSESDVATAWATVVNNNRAEQWRQLAAEAETILRDGGTWQQAKDHLGTGA